MTGEVKLNLGCGEFYAPGWTNVDHGTPHRHDVSADLRKPLPFGPGTVARAYLGHVLEHLTLPRCRLLLNRLRPLMAPGGAVLVVGPDIHRARDLVALGEQPESLITAITDGGCRWPGDAHQWTCEPAVLADLLTAAGWSGVAEVPIAEVGDDWPVTSRVGWQCAVLAAA